jgi:hypothetical protein
VAAMNRSSEPVAGSIGPTSRPASLDDVAYLPNWKVASILSSMESSPLQQDPHDLGPQLAAADKRRERLAASLRLPTGMHPALAAAVAFQVATAAYGVAAQTTAGLAVALGGVAVFLGVAAFMLYRFGRINGVRVDGLSSQIILGTGGTSTLVYLGAFAAGTWAAFESRWWLVGVAAGAAGVGYSFGNLRWWYAYKKDPAAHAGGTSPRVLALLAVVACLGLVALLVLG